MAVKIRLARRGRKKLALYDIVAADSRSPRDGRIIEKLGTYNPMTTPAVVELKEDRALYWIMQGAQPTETASNLLSKKGIMLRKHLQVGVNKEAITQEQADGKFEAWKKEKALKNLAEIKNVSDQKEKETKQRLEQEKKANLNKAKAIEAKQKPPQEEELAEEQNATVDASKQEETPAETTSSEAAKAEEASEDAADPSTKKASNDDAKTEEKDKE